MAAKENIGNHLNAWRYPVFTLGRGEEDIQRQITENKYIKSINISKSEWDRHCTWVDAVLDIVISGLKMYSQEDFKGLIFHDNIRQGSSREGLRVNDAKEFDCLVEFEIQGMQVTECQINDEDGILMPEFIKLRVENPKYLLSKYPWLNSYDIITETGLSDDTTFNINTKNLQEKVFKPLMLKSIEQVYYNLSNKKDKSFLSGLSVRPPTFAISFCEEPFETYSKRKTDEFYLQMFFPGLKKKEPLPTVEIDFVPALLLRKDLVPNPYTENQDYGEMEMTCAVYAVMKWEQSLLESEQTINHDYRWRESTCGYEKQIHDVGRRNPSQRYVMTACRIVKSYVKWIISNCRNTNQLQHVAGSYYLKNLCFHCIALLTIPSKTKSLSGVKEALGYFLLFLKLCIENHKLPHFFYDNPWAFSMFPNCTFGCNKSKKNLYSGIHEDTFILAETAFQTMLQDLKGLYTEFDSLDSDLVGPFKELLGLTHEYRQPTETHRPCSSS